MFQAIKNEKNKHVILPGPLVCSLMQNVQNYTNNTCSKPDLGKRVRGSLDVQAGWQRSRYTRRDTMTHEVQCFKDTAMIRMSAANTELTQPSSLNLPQRKQCLCVCARVCVYV